MDILTGIQNVLEYINNHWTAITIILGLATIIIKKIKDYFSKSEEERIAIAKAQISEIMLMLVTEVECQYLEWSKAGEVKRAQVISQIFAMYPVLSNVTNQEEIIAWIDEAIDNALKVMRKIFEENQANQANKVEN